MEHSGESMSEKGGAAFKVSGDGIVLGSCEKGAQRGFKIVSLLLVRRW